MDIKTLNRGDAQKAMEEWVHSYPDLPPIDSSYNSVRSSIQELNRTVRNIVGNEFDDKYYIDAHLGLMLYEYLYIK